MLKPIPSYHQDYQMDPGSSQPLNLSFSLVLLSALLMLSGDVELNPGPETVLVARDLKMVRNFIWRAHIKWYDIGVELEMDPSTLQAIKENFSNNPANCFSQVLLDWLEGQGLESTWSNLAAALKAPPVGMSALAEAIEAKYLGDTHQPGAELLLPDNTPTSCTSSEDSSKPQYPESVITSTISSCSSSELSAVDLTPCFPFLATEDLSEAEKDFKRQQLYSETQDIRRKFAGLVFNLQKTVEKFHSVKDVKNVLIYHDRNFENLLQGCATIADTFVEASKYWSFFDHGMIKLLTKELGTNSNKKKLRQFQETFQEYSRRRICECPSDVFGEKETSDTVLVLKSEMKVEDTTVEELRIYQHRMNRILKTSTMRLLHVNKGCLELTFRVLGDALRIEGITEEKQQALRNMGIISISYGELHFDLTPLVKSEGTDAPLGIEEDPLIPALSLVGPMTALDIKGDADDNIDADSGLGTISDVTGTDVGSYPTDDMSIVTAGLRTEVSDEFQDYIGRDLKDPRLDMIVSAETTTEYSSELHEAASAGNLDLVKQLIAKGHNPMVKNIDNNTALHCAALYDKLDVIKFLLEEVSCNPAPSGWHGKTPLHSAAEAGHLSIVEYLIEKHQVDPLSLDEDGCSPLHRACVGGDLNVVKFMMKTMLEYMKIEEIFTDSSKHETTPVHEAALKGHLNIVKYLISECKCDPNHGGHCGRGVLFSAAQEGHLSIVKFLTLECGCDPESTDMEQSTPLHLAAQYGHLPVIKFLSQEMKSNPNYRDERNNTPLHEAALAGHCEVVEYFIDTLHCSPNTPGQYGRMPLHMASEEGHLNLVKNLVEKYACDPNSLDDNKVTPLHMAAMTGHLSIVRYLTQNKECNNMYQDINGDTPLHLAAKHGQLSVVKHFVERLHCPLHTKNKFNKTPLQLALEKGHSEVVDYLE